MKRKKLGVGTLFRDSLVWCGHQVGQVTRFFNQIDSQTGFNNSNRLIYALEGDSEDDTLESLMQKERGRSDFTLLKHDSGGFMRSNADSGRMARLSKLGDKVLGVLEGKTEYVLWVESDLIMVSDTMVQNLVGVLDDNSFVGAIAPLVTYETHLNRFYDVWGFRNLNGVSWKQNGGEMARARKSQWTSVASVGSCCLFRGTLLEDGVRFKQGAFVDFCSQIKARNYEIWVDSKEEVRHPSKMGMINGRWI